MICHSGDSGDKSWRHCLFFLVCRARISKRVCVYACMRACTSASACMHMHACMHVHACMCACMCACMHVCVCLRACMRACMRVWWPCSGVLRKEKLTEPTNILPCNSKAGFAYFILWREFCLINFYFSSAFNFIFLNPVSTFSAVGYSGYPLLRTQEYESSVF